MLYLTTHSTHFILRLYGVGHMVIDHSDSERGNPLPPHGLLFLINSKGSYMHHPTDRTAHTTAFVTPVVKHWLEREIAQWVHPMKDRSDDPSHHERPIAPWATLLPWSYISLPLHLPWGCISINLCILINFRHLITLYINKTITSVLLLSSKLKIIRTNMGIVLTHTTQKQNRHNKSINQNNN